VVRIAAIKGADEDVGVEHVLQRSVSSASSWAR
jgi:hypothetical protein